jgi:predicted dehydrogenase
MSSEENKTADRAPGGVRRRTVLGALASLPFFGGFFYSLFKKKTYDDARREAILSELGLGRGGGPAILPRSTFKKPGQHIRLGFIGFGGRAEDLAVGAGFAHPDLIAEQRKAARENKENKWLETWMNQDDLNVSLAAVCDLFDIRAERGLAAAANPERPSGAKGYSGAKRYRRYTDLLADPEIDAVVIGTPDHWHARIICDAASAGKHVYCEKCMTRTEEEAHRVLAAVKSNRIVFQLGHQNRQQESHRQAREIVRANILGPVNLVETTTNRNSPNGAWVYDIHPQASEANIDWGQFEEPCAVKVPFSKERFFRWRCWYDYGTGLSGDLLSHEYDAVNQILDLGIPRFATASGGTYFYKDGRDVPDVFQAVFEYPDRDLTLVYSATLSNGRDRGRVFMGHDASMEVMQSLTVNAEWESTRYKDKIDRKIIDPDLPLVSFSQGAKGIDTVTSATEKYFASRGLMYTYRGGRIMDVTHLHIADWLDCIRNGGQPACNIDRGFEEAITCHMATRSFLEGRRVEWDPVNRKIV